jgi:MFS family permease
MNPGRWQEIERLYHAALACPAEARAAFLAVACEGDETLRLAECTVGAFWAIRMDIAPRYSGFASGFMNSGSAFAAIVSLIIGGYIVDRTGNWELTFVAGIALLIFGAIAAFWMKPDEELEDTERGLPVTSPSVATAR